MPATEDASPAEKSPPLSAQLSSEKFTSISTQMKVGELPGHSVIVDVRSVGKEVWKIFKENPELPGIIFVDDTEYAGMVSNSQFHKVMSRPYGREIFEGRPLSLLLKELRHEPLLLEHDLDIQNAMEACLEREAKYIYEPFLAVNREKGLIKVCTVQVLMHASAKASHFRNQQMEQILGSVTDGLLLVDRDFRIGSEHSKALEQILGRSDISGKLFAEIFSPVLGPQLLSQTAEYLEVLFDRKMIDRLIKSINPIREATFSQSDPSNPDGKLVKYLAFGFERIRSQGEIKQILVRIEDITRRVILARELQQRDSDAEQRMRLMVQIVSVEPNTLKIFLDTFERQIALCLQTVRNISSETQVKLSVEAVSRIIHGLKGEAALLQLEIHQNILHHFEDSLEPLRSADCSQEKLQSLEPALKKLLEPVQLTRGILDQFGKWNSGSNSPATPQENSNTIAHLFMPQILDLVRDLSAKLGKKSALHSMMDETLLPSSYSCLVKDVLVQLVRNSLAHGLETPEERQRAGKSPEGTLQIALETTADCIEIIFQDDGAGLDMGKIKERAREMNLSAMDDESLKNLIFSPGFSTAGEITEFSGRGVGLDLIRDRISERGGRVAVYSEQGVYCAFKIFLPKTDLERP